MFSVLLRFATQSVRDKSMIQVKVTDINCQKNRRVTMLLSCID